ncbi:MAG: hypothetical protein ACRD3M_13875, partial [Thermoanaerobaculia bacterium]
AWIVGGAPRDGLLGWSAPDVDVAVAGDVERLARELQARGFGTAVAISEGSPRVFRVAGRLALDLAELEGDSIEEDLARRDFTANAIAIELATGKWIDPFDGARDLCRRRLRLVRESNLEEDPLRAFRAARFYATHGLCPDRQTRQACLAVAPRLAEAAAERVQAELSRMLEAPRVGPAFRWARRAGLLSPALGIAAAPAGWDRAARILSRLDAAAARLPAARRRLLRLAAIGAGLRMSPAEAARWLRRRRHSRPEAGAAASLIELSGRAARAREPGGRWAWIHDAGPLAQDALALLEASDPRQAPLAIGLRRLLARRRRRPQVTGADLLGWLALPPGPRVGELLRQVRIEILRGAVRTRGQARHFLLGKQNLPAG